MSGIVGKTTVSFSSGFFAKVRTAAFTGMNRKSIDVSSSDSVDWKEFIPSKLSDPGGVKLTFLSDGSKTPPMQGNPETCTTTFVDGSSIACTGFVTDYEITGEYEGEVVATGTLKFTGQPTFAGA